MTRRIGFGVVALILVLMLVAPSLASARRAGGATVAFDFQRLRQGRVGIVRVSGQDITAVRAVFQERVYYFYPEQDGFAGLISADMESDLQPYVLQIWVEYADGQGERIDKDIEIASGEFGRADVTLSPSLSALLQPEVNDAEDAALFNIFNRFTPEQYWDSGFVMPTAEPLIAWFGGWRLYNGSYWYRHTGLDMKMPIGTPVNAMASGRVMLSEMMAIRGGYIVIDHGWGVYSGYAHLSERFVVPGQWVRQGDVIGLSGLNGRSSGAHLHFEMAVGGVWVDPEQFLTLGLTP